MHDTFAPLALLASGERRYLPAVEKSARMHAATTHAGDESPLINWRYMAAAIVLSEYYLATDERWVRDELQEVYDFLVWSQYMDLAQVNERVKETHPDAWPSNALDAHGGWGHNPGFEGYGPICMLTGPGRAGLRADGALRHRRGPRAARRGLRLPRSAAPGPTATSGTRTRSPAPQDWADMGRTGAAGIANRLSPYDDARYRRARPGPRARDRRAPRELPRHARLAADGDGLRGARRQRRPAFTSASLMDANRWWFVLAQCSDGSFYYQPNRDNAGYGADSRIAASAVTAFLLSIPRRSLHLAGKPFPR